MREIKGSEESVADIHKAFTVFADVRRAQAAKGIQGKNLLPLDQFWQILHVLLPKWKDAACLTEVLQLPEHLGSHWFLSTYQQIWSFLVKTDQSSTSSSSSTLPPTQTPLQTLMSFIATMDENFETQNTKEKYLFEGGQWLQDGLRLDQIKEVVRSIKQLPSHFQSDVSLISYASLCSYLIEKDYAPSSSSARTQSLIEALTSFVAHVEGCFKEQRLKETYLVEGIRWITEGYSVEQVKYKMNILNRFPLDILVNDDLRSNVDEALRLILRKEASLELYMDVVAELAKYDGEAFVNRFVELSGEAEERQSQKQRHQASTHRELRPAQMELRGKKKEKKERKHRKKEK